MTRHPIGPSTVPLTPRHARRRAGVRADPPRRLLPPSVALAVAAAPAAATMYKWVDANGRVVYSDQPPPANVKSEVVKPPPPPANPNAAQELEEQDVANKQRDKKRAEDAKAAETARQTSERRREVCVTGARADQGAAAKDEAMYRFNEKGEKVYLQRRDAARGVRAPAAACARELPRVSASRDRGVGDRESTSSRDWPG